MFSLYLCLDVYLTVVRAINLPPSINSFGPSYNSSDPNKLTKKKRDVALAEGTRVETVIINGATAPEKLHT